MIIIRLTSCVLVGLIFSAPCFAEVSKSALKNRIQVEAKKIIVETINGDESNDQQYSQYAVDIANTVSKLPDEKIDDEIAVWIESSLLAIISKRAAVLRDPNKKSEQFVNEFTAIAEKQFSGLSNTKAIGLLAKKKKAQVLVNSYRKELFYYIVTKLMNSRQFDIDISREVIFADASVMAAASRAMKAGKDAKDQKNGEFSDLKLTSQAKIIESNLISSSLVYEVQTIFDKQALMESFDYGNILSKAFDDGDPLNIDSLAKFNSVKPKIDKFWVENISTDKGTIKLSLSSLYSLISEFGKLRNPGYQIVVKDINKNSGLAPVYVSFVNNRVAWEPLLSKYVPAALKAN